MKTLIKYIVLSLTYIFYINCNSQSKGLVHYGQIESIGLKSANGPDFNSYLAFDNNQSYYVTAKDSLETKDFKRRYKSDDGLRVISFPGGLLTDLGRQVYYDKSNDSLYWNQWRLFYVKEKTPKINWILDTITKQIGNYKAHKATGFFRGRHYTAWYTLDIPLPYGPWKLQGLPGLILEAYDKDKEMYIYFKSIEYPTSSNVTIKQIVWPKDIEHKWKSLSDFKTRLDKIYERSRNSSIIIAQKLNSDVPEQKIKSEAFLESF